MNLAQAANGFHGLGEGVAVATERRTIPFDYAFRFDLEGKVDLVQNKTLTVSIEASFTAVSIGYGVVPKVPSLKFGLLPNTLAAGATTAPQEVQNFVGTLQPSFNAILGTNGSSRDAIRQFAQRSFLRMTVAALAETMEESLSAASPVIGPRTAAALRDGIKFNPDLVQRLLLSLDGAALDDPSLLEAFQAVAAPPDRILFKYALIDEGSGREFQSEPILSIAGLGSSDGVRPFRYFARPIEFAPRTTIRMQITEVSDFQGELHVSLQGYKTLGGLGSPTATGAARRPPSRRRMRR
jgi:hypothetical protein